MRKGALVMIDALGFKGIWNRPGVRERPQIVIEKLEALKKAADAHLASTIGTPERQAEQRKLDEEEAAAGINHRQWIFERVEVVFLSDTIVLGFAESPRGSIGLAPLSSSVTEAACRYTSAILGMAATSEPALAYRGCMSYGEFEMHPQFILGRAVDEAAESMDKAQGAFVWLAPSARRECTLTATPGIQRSDLYSYRVPYAVPMKGGDTYETIAVSPFLLANTEEDCRATEKRILDTFSGPLEVEIKRQNTAKFLKQCMSLWLPPRAPRRPTDEPIEEGKA